MGAWADRYIAACEAEELRWKRWYNELYWLTQASWAAPALYSGGGLFGWWSARWGVVSVQAAFGLGAWALWRWACHRHLRAMFRHLAALQVRAGLGCSDPECMRCKAMRHLMESSP